MISFIIPVFNAEKFLTETIQSALDSGYPNFEIVLVDDGSKDNSASICHDFAKRHPGVVFLFQHHNNINKGVSATRRLGISKAKGEFIYFLDADDTIVPGTINQYAEIFASKPEIVLIHGNINVISDQAPHFNVQEAFDLGTIDKMYNLSRDKEFLKKNNICNSTVCLRKDILDGIDFEFDQAFQVEDWVLWTLLSETGMFYYIANPVINYRYHEQSATYMIGRKGHVYLTYTRIEFYFAVLAKCKTRAVKKKVSNLLYEHLGMLYKFYSKTGHRKLASSLYNKTSMKDFLKGLIGKR
jgi:glycosyltransferase involved in cell wall biosynthesis